MIDPFAGGRQPKSPRQLDRIYRMPVDTRSILDFDRARHRDLPALSDLDLHLEDRAVLNRLVYQPAGFDRDWLMARREAIARERQRRVPDHRQGQPTTARPAPAMPGPAFAVPSGAVLAPLRGGGRRRG